MDGETEMTAAEAETAEGEKTFTHPSRKRTISKASRRLTSKAIAEIKKPGLCHDGNGIYLQTTRGAGGSLNHSWIFRFRLAGLNRSMGLGAYPGITIARARELAGDARELIQKGIDPVWDREANKLSNADRAAKEAEERKWTFGVVADEWFNTHSPRWGEVHRRQVRGQLDRFCKPIWDRPIKDLHGPDIAEMLRPIYKQKAITALRTLNNIGKVFDTAIATKRYVGDNPASSVGVLFPAPSSDNVEHYPAIPVEQMPAFAAQLRATPGIVARALEFLMLTAIRSRDVRSLKFDDINVEEATWTIERTRNTKQARSTKRDFEVPLVPRALEIVEEMRKIQQNEFVFAGARAEQIGENEMNDLMKKLRPGFVAHGLRSSFRDWVGDHTSYEADLAEYCLMHKVGTKVERAYRRGTGLKKRVSVMHDWAAFVAQPVGTGAGNVHKLRA